MRTDAYRADTGPAAAMRNAEGFMQVKMGDIRADFTGAAQTHQRFFSKNTGYGTI